MKTFIILALLGSFAFADCKTVTVFTEDGPQVVTVCD